MKTDPATQLPECEEGPEAYRRFDDGVRQILSVPHSTLVRRERLQEKIAGESKTAWTEA